MRMKIRHTGIMRAPPISPVAAASALLLSVITIMAGSSSVDIDYSHNVEGIGTVITDYKMGSSESTEAVGKVRGTGEVMTRYTYQSNNSENITIEDQFSLTALPSARDISISDYPQMSKAPGSFRMLGTAWAGNISLSA